MNILNEVINKLKEKAIVSSTATNNLQVNSVLDEHLVIAQICNIFSENENKYPFSQFKIIQKESERDWFDLGLKNKQTNLFIPINIKSIQSKDSADNTNCKLGLLYTLTGKLPEEINVTNQIHWNNYFKVLNQNLNSKSDKDYYFIVYNKNNNQDIFWTSLRNLTNIQCNGNNLPFQINWSSNKQLSKKSPEEVQYLLLSKLQESIDKRAQIAKDFANSGLKKYIIKPNKNNVR